MTGAMIPRRSAFAEGLPPDMPLPGGRPRRRPTAFDAGLASVPGKVDTMKLLGRGETVRDPLVSNVIAGGGTVGVRPMTMMETEARKNRKQLGLDGNDPWQTAGSWQGKSKFL